MAELRYSPEAIGSLRVFHRVDAIILVEGHDDELFWECLFDKFSSISTRAHPVGGKPELLKYATLIRTGELDAIAAMDRDYSFIESDDPHSNVVTTCGYSIENTLAFPAAIVHVITHLGRISVRDVNVADVEDWLRRFSSTVRELIHHDICCQQDGRGEVVASNNCARFMKSQHSPEVSASKIAKHLSTLTVTMSPERRAAIEEKAIEAGLHNSDIVRGHFLFSAVYRYVVAITKTLDSKVSISTDTLLGSFLMAFKATFEESHPHYEYYASVIASVRIWK